MNEGSVGVHEVKQVADADREYSGEPIHKLDFPLGLDVGDGSIDVLGHHIAPVEHATGHLLAVEGIALHHLVSGLEA